MSNQSGFDYDVLISRLHGGVRAFQSLRAHRRLRDQPPAPASDERPTPTPSRPSLSPDEPAPAAVSSLEPQAFIAMNGRVVPLFGDLGGVFAPVSPGGPMPPPSSDTPPGPPRAAPSPEELKPPPSATAPAPAPSPLKLPPPTPPARLGLIYGGNPRTPATEPPPATSPAGPPASDGPATSSTNPDQATPAKVQETPTIAAIVARLDARAQEEALRLNKILAEHRACVTQILQEHRDELRAQREADATRTAQLLRDLLAEHRAELSRAAQAHADQLTQFLAQHQQHPNTEHEPATPSNDELRSALLEQAKLQRDATEATAEHIGALTTIVADLGQTIATLAVAAARASSPAIPSPSQSTAAVAPRQTTPATTAPSLPEPMPPVPVPEDRTAPPVTRFPRVSQPATPGRLPASDRSRIVQCIDDERDDELTPTHDDDPAPRSRLPPITPLTPTVDPGDG
jgi:hypothetical protein